MRMFGRSICISQYCDMKRLFLFAVCFLPAVSFAQGAGGQLGWFPNGSVGHTLNEDWSVSTFGFLMASKAKPHMLLAYAETNVTRKLNSRWSSTASYTREKLRPGSNNVRHEHRGWVQLQAVLPGGSEGVRWGHRVRWDQRYLSSETPGPWLVRPRLRYQVSRMAELDGGWSARLDAEAFLEMHGAGSSRFVEAWSSAGMRKRLGAGAAVEVGVQHIAWRDGVWTHYILLSTGIHVNI